MPIPVEPLSYVGVMAVMIVVIWRVYVRITDNHKGDIDRITNDFKGDIGKVNGECVGIRERLTVMETKQDIYLHELGFDVAEVNSTIKSNIEEIKRNDKPSIGCIDVDKLKRKKQED